MGVKNCTTAGLAKQIFRYVHLKPYTVGITREQGYPEEVQSEMAREYLAYRNRVDFDCRLRTSSSTKGEKKITIEREVELPLIGGSNDFHTVGSRKRKRCQKVFDTKSNTFKVDGYYEGDADKPPTAIEFNGCLWHDCDECYSPDTHSPFSSLRSRRRKG